MGKFLSIGRLERFPHGRNRSGIPESVELMQRFQATGSFKPGDFGGRKEPKLARHEAVISVCRIHHNSQIAILGIGGKMAATGCGPDSVFFAR